MTRGMTDAEKSAAAGVAERVSRALSETELAKLAQDAWIYGAVSLGVGIGEVARSQSISAQTAYRAIARHERRLEEQGAMRGQTSLLDAPGDTPPDTAPVSGRRRKGGDGAQRRL